MQNKLFNKEGAQDVIPHTRNGLPAMECLSAMQKYIRRNEEANAMEVAVELSLTSKGFNTMVCSRLRIICWEDIDTITQRGIIADVYALTDAAKADWDSAKPGRALGPIGRAIQILSRAPKSRQGDHLLISKVQAALLEGFVPTIPDWAKDGHTLSGKRKGRGVDYFREVSTQLVPAPTEADPYEEEAYRLLAIKEGLKGGKKS
jgi:replication-associated recombination protein RarA